MKYVRTDDGRIFELEYDLDIIVITKKECPETENFVKKADTIEELCDEFLGIVKDDGVEPHFMEEDVQSLLFEMTKYKCTLEDTNVYGAIWTDRGLIFVAKMNKNGELELL